PRDAYAVVIDTVAGPRWPDLIDSLRRGGRYVVAGAIAGPVVNLDVRTVYLRDLSFFGSTFQPDKILTDLVSYIEANEIHPAIAEIFQLKDIKAAQEAFLSKSYIGKIGVAVSA
ncbi:MAG: zinc-binding dehydrogenase, partial [Hyphomicrobiales bacterium]|nr:zinc-binding dehydrogenase [Hyphomicrobiales bacterium]